MSDNQPVRTAVRRPTSTVLVALIVVLIAAVVLVSWHGFRSSAGSTPQARPPENIPPTAAHNVAKPAPHRQHGRLRGEVPGESPGRLQSRTLGAADGEVADGTTVLADVPAVTNLDSALRAALRMAADDAAAEGVELDVNSGWRSYAYQEQLFEQAVARYGSRANAERWVARPGTSVHEAGEAVDIGPASAAAWLARHGAAFGLCPIYRNEPWHYELRPDASDHGCPAAYSDAAHDPRMQP